jgi:hypothetical protein
MSIPTADDYAPAEIDTLATAVMGKLKTMRFRGRGKAAALAVMDMRADLRELLQEMVDKSMEWADRCQSMTEDNASSDRQPTSTPRRRHTDRLPPKRKTKSKSGNPLRSAKRFRAKAWRMDNVLSWRPLCRFPMPARQPTAGPASCARLARRGRRYRAENPRAFHHRANDQER